MRITIETERLILRPFEPGDAKDMFINWASDAEVTKYVTWNTHKDVNETQEIINLWVIQYEKPERINFAIELKETKELIGGIDVVGYLDGVPVIGYAICKKFWGKGITTEACKRVIELLFEIEYDKVIIEAVVENIASNKVILKCGGIYVRTYESYVECKNTMFEINSYIVKK